MDSLKCNWLICSLHWNHDSQKMYNCCWFWQSSVFRLTLLRWNRHELFHQRCSWKTLIFQGVLVFRNLSFLFFSGNLSDHKCLNCWWYELFWTLDLLFLQRNWIHIMFQGLNLKLSTCFGFSRYRFLILICSVETWWIRFAKYCFYLYQIWIFKFVFHLCFTYFVSSFPESSESFINWAEIFVSKYFEVCFQNQIWNADRP